MEENNRQQSEFNMAVSYLNRLNNLFYSANMAAMSLDAYSWFHSLLALFRELSTEMKEEEVTDWDDKIKNINEGVSLAIRDSQKHGVVQIQPELYDKLHKFELFLRKVLKEAGLQAKMADDASKALR